MDNFVQINKLSETKINSSNSEVPNIIEPIYKTFVPKIRIRLRPNSEQIKSNVLRNICAAPINKSESGNSNTLLKTNSHFDLNQDTTCYKILEDSGGGRDVVSEYSKITSYSEHNFILHGINLRARLPKPVTSCKKTKKSQIKITDDKVKKENKIETEVVNQPMIRSICVKNSYKSFQLNSKNHRIKDSSNRKSISKVRNEILESINLKEIINQENFLKLSPEIQWQLVKLLPNCDKPKSPDNQSNCHCSDVVSSLIEPQKQNPSVTANALSNEFIVKALNRYSMKMGQSELINLLTSERDNLRSRPVSILNEEPALIDSIDGIKIEKSDCNFAQISDIKCCYDIKSNSSVCSTETMEMNCAGNLFENISLKTERNVNKFDATCDVNYFTERRSNRCDFNEGSSSNDKDSIGDSQCDKAKVPESNVDYIHDKRSCLDSLSSNRCPGLTLNCDNMIKNISNDTTNICNQLKYSETVVDQKQKRGRKRKSAISSEDIRKVPVKRSNRSTAGKRPARLDSDSPSSSHSHNLTTEKKSNHIKLKKHKEHNRNHRKCKTKHDNSSDESESLMKTEGKLSKQFRFYEASNYSKNYPSSPESLPMEGDFSPFSKASPTGSSLLEGLCRSNSVSLYNDKKISSHVNSGQALSPSWSCTSESTTPSMKSDYGYVHPTITSIQANSATGNIDQKISTEPESRSLQRMPPPRQTLTLAAMREKMRAKKMAKEDNRNEIAPNNKRSSSINHSKNKKQNTECLSLLKEGEDDIQIMDKMMNSSEDFDELINSNHDSLLEFFMSDDNYDFESTADQSSNNSSSIQKPSNTRKSISKATSFAENAPNKDSISGKNHKKHSNKDNTRNSKKDSCHYNSKTSNQKVSSIDDSTQLGKSIADTIATVLHKLNSSKENGVVINSCATKASVPNAYLVDGNGLSTALSIIQSLNPGAKVTTQQFYLVNSGPQLVLQPSPPTITNILTPDKLTSVPINTKVSLAPKIAINQSAIARQSSLLSPATNDILSSQLSFSPNIKDKQNQGIITESSLRNTNCLKMTVSTDSVVKTSYMMSQITSHNLSAPPSVNSLHLQTISTPHPIGLVHSVQPPLPSLFSSQLRFVHPSPLSTNQNTSNTISLIGPSIPSAGAINQSPKLLVLCPTVGNVGQPNLVASSSILANQNDQKFIVANSNVMNNQNDRNYLVASSNVLANQNDQKYLLLSKQPDKQATIQLVSSQGLWQQLNPAMISQANNVLVMQPQTQSAQINPFESLLCSSSQTLSISDPNRTIAIEGSSLETAASSLIIDSRSSGQKLSTDDDPATATSSIGYVVEHTNTSSSLSHFFGFEESSSLSSVIDNCVVVKSHCQDISPT